MLDLCNQFIWPNIYCDIIIGRNLQDCRITSDDDAWLARFPTDPRADLPQLDPLPMHAEWIRTAHYLVGTLIFSTTVMTALTAHRRWFVAADTIAAPARELEVAL